MTEPERRDRKRKNKYLSYMPRKSRERRVYAGTKSQQCQNYSV